MLRDMIQYCWLAGLCLALLLGACTNDAGSGSGPGTQRGPGAQRNGAERPLPVALAAVTRGTVTAGWTGTATLLARDDALVAARVGGEVAEVLVDVGDRVAAGDALVRLDSERLRLESQRAEAVYRQRRAEAERSERLLARNLVAVDAHEQALANMRTARAEYELAALTVREATVRAPFAGEIAERHVTRGNTIAAGETAFRIVAVDALEATVAVPERELGPLRVGQPAALRADALSDVEFSAEVARIAPVVAADSGTVAVTLRVRDESGLLRAGMFVRARVVHDRREDVLLVPVAAVQRDDGADYLFTAELNGDGELRARRTRIEAGYREGGFIEVRDGIGESARVVASGGTGLRDGALLSDVDAPAAAERPALSDEAIADAPVVDG